jgi:hypothetical protein
VLFKRDHWQLAVFLRRDRSPSPCATGARPLETCDERRPPNGGIMSPKIAFRDTNSANCVATPRPNFRKMERVPS